MSKSTSRYDNAIKQCAEAWSNYAKELVEENERKYFPKYRSHNDKPWPHCVEMDSDIRITMPTCYVRYDIYIKDKESCEAFISLNGEDWRKCAELILRKLEAKRMPKTQLEPPTIKAIESVLSKGDRAVVIPLKDGGVRVNHEMSKTVCVQEARNEKNCNL